MKKLLIITVIIILLLLVCKAQEITGGNIHIQNRDYDKAIAQFKLATEKYPNKAAPYVSLTAAYFEKKDFMNAADALYQAFQINKEEAKSNIKWYEKFLNRDELAWNIFYNGAIVFREDDLEKSLELIIQSEEVENLKNKSYSYNLHANILSIMDKDEESLVYYKKAIEADETNIDPYITLGRYYVIDMQPETAVLYLEKALEIDTTVTEVYTVLGQVYLDLKEYNKALGVLKKSASIMKDNPSILFNLALAYFQAGDHQSAIETAKKVIDKEKVDPEISFKAYNLIGQVYITDEKYNEAISYLKEATQKNPNNCETYRLIAHAYWKLDNKNLSSDYAEKYDACLKKEE